ncbi:hypothetical protein DFR52_10119 [Hoeflea marina]|uniref:Uncharacterized protein n=1 Tax=Hoeflea marina TaxID=274592 RepID=A0A317PQ73_9HYPH|nr:hypothetical protein [Hoeflea marina]PWW03339.1 hypothetical protein DFR52_10119 [Hoeflea marina]
MSIRTSRRPAGAAALRLAMAGLLAITALMPVAATPARAFTGGNFPACEAPQVLTYIQKRFVWTDQHLLKRGLAIDAIHHPETNRVVPAGYGEPIGRLYCHATARMNDGHKREIWYLIEAGMGFAGIADNVEFCISGLDPFKVYGAWCRSVR